MKHNIPIRVYYEDTDAGGVVYHANYLKFAERGRTEFLRALGYENNSLKKNQGIIFVVRHMSIDYLKPSVLDDLLSLETTIETMKNTSFTMHQTVYRSCDEKVGGGSIIDDDNRQEKRELICDMHVALVCVDIDNIKPARIPDGVKRAFSKYLE